MQAWVRLPHVALLGCPTLGGSRMSTLGQPRAGMRVGPVVGGARRRHDSKKSHKLAMASTWEMHVGGGASLGVPDMACRPWIILSSAKGDRIVW
jgi:hypothetical protein